MRRWVLGLACLLVLLLVAPLACAWYALYTPGGLQAVLHLVPTRLPGFELHISGASGTLAGALHADTVDVRTPRAHVVVHDIDLRPSLRLAVLQTLVLRSARVGALEVQVFHRTTSRRPVRFMPHWLNLHVDSLRVAQVHVVLPSGKRFDATDFSSHGIVRARTIRYFDARMNTGGLAWRSDEGVLRGARTLGVEAGLALDYHTRGRVPWQVQLSGTGDLNALQLEARFLAPFDATFSGQGLDLSEAWHLQGDLAVRRFELNTWGGGHALGAAHGALHLSGNLKGFAAHGPVLFEFLKAGTLDLSLRASYANRTVSFNELIATQPQLGWRVQAHGTATVVPGGPQLDLAGNWAELRLPLASRDGLRSRAGSFTVSGTWPYVAHSAGDLQVPRLPPLTYELDARLFKDHAQVLSATALTAGGSARFGGELAWPPALSWSASGTMADVDPAAFASVPRGRLGFTFKASGAGFRRGSDFSVQLRDVAGTLRGLPARGAGSLARERGAWRFDAIRAQVGGAAIALDGTLTDHADVRFDVQAPDLSLVHPGLRGTLAAAGVVHGTLRDPAVDATAHGSALQYGRVTLGKLDARVDFDTHRSGPSHVLLQAHDLALGTRHIDDALLQLDGGTARHSLTLALHARDLRIDAAGSGSFLDGNWRADLSQVQAHGGDALNLQLAAPANVLLSPNAASLSQLCLTGQPARLCARAEWTPQHWSMAASATELPMQTLTAGSAASLDYRGEIGLQLALAGAPGQPATGSLEARLTDAQLRHRTAGGRMEITTLGSGDVRVTADPQAVTARVGLDAGPVGAINGTLSAQRNGSVWQDMPLSGQLNLNTAELSFIPLYVPQVDRAAGRLDASLTLGGTVGSPLLGGSLSLSGGELDLYRVNLAMRATTLKAELSGNSLEFDGAAQLGAGHAAAHGRLQWQAGAPHGSFTLSGENLRVADVPEAQVDASPDLAFNVDGSSITVTGTVHIPHARLAPADLTNAVLPSSDEVIVGSDTGTPDSGGHFKVTSDVTLALGDDVTIEGMGLKARLAGSITAHAATGEEVTRASGEVNVAQGDYTAYGRKLDIDRGRLIFNGGPVNDPGVDVRAVKRFDDPTVGATLAGINVRGTLRQPRLSFFSEPPLPQQEIVGLILAGGGLMAGQTNGVAGSTAASRGATNNELLGQGAAILGQQIGSKIGIQDVGVESNIYNETSLVLGRYLSPRLYVSYGLGLTQTLNTVKLRYTLGDHWMIRTEAGNVGGADLVYTLDK